MLREFETVCSPVSPKHLRHAMIRAFVEHLQRKGNAVATQNKALRVLRAAFREGVALDCIAVNPMRGWKWLKEPKHTHRILSGGEEVKLIGAAERLYGHQMVMFIRFLLESWCRFSEATKLRWENVEFDADKAGVTFRNTKSREDRFVPIDPTTGLLADLRKLQIQTLQDGGPFLAYRDKANLARRCARIVKAAGIEPISRHDLRRTGITRALLAGMPVTAVQKIAGHKSLTTTAKFYLEVNRDDLRAAVLKLRQAANG